MKLKKSSLNSINWLFVSICFSACWHANADDDLSKVLLTQEEIIKKLNSLESSEDNYLGDTIRFA